MASVLRSVHSAEAPTERISSTSVSVSRIRGTLFSVTGCSVSSAAAMIGSAAFLLPAGSIVPERRCPPSITYWMGEAPVGSLMGFCPKLGLNGVESGGWEMHRSTEDGGGH